MSLAIPDDALDPVARKVAEVAGLISSGSDPQVRDAFLAHPLEELAAAVRDRQPQLIELLGELLGSSEAGTLGLPAAGEDRWLPIKGPDGAPTGLYLVLRSESGTLHVALGWRWTVTAGDLDVSLWAQLPLLSTGGTASSTAVNIASPEAPLRVAAEVRLRGGFGAAGLAFNGVRASLTITGLTAPPQVALVMLGLQLPGEATARDRSLAELASLPGSAWIETAVALFTAQLQAIAGPQAAALVSHLLPLVGLTAPAPLPRLAWEQLPSRGALVFEDWFLALTNSSDAMGAWLGHWQGLLQAGAGGPVPIAFNGRGSRAEPWQAGVTVGPVQIQVLAAVEPRAAGGRDLYLGLRVGSTPIALGASSLRLDIAAAAELVAIPIGAAAPVRALPSMALALKFYSAAGRLVDHTFTAPDPLAALSHLQVGSLEAGLGLDAAGALKPLLRLRDVECARGQWPLLDLSSANAVLDGLGDIASNLIQQQLEQGLGLLDAGAHVGRRIAALLGLVKPTSVTGTWPVSLVSDVSRIAQFLGDPLAAIGRYHAAALTTLIDGQPAWRHLLNELAELLRGSGLPQVALRGQGSPADPWRVQLALAEAGALTLRAVKTMDGQKPRLLLSAAFEPRPLAVEAMQLSMGLVADLLQLDLADPASALRGSGHWLPALRAELRLTGPQGIETPWLGGLRLGADAVAASLAWQPSGVAWQVALEGARAQWRGRSGPPLSLPALALGSAVPSWNLAAPDLGGALGTNARDAVAELVQFLIGQGLLEHGGPAGFGLSALLGLLPGDPGLSLPAWQVGQPSLALPDDFPRLQPADWGAFFQDPRPALRAHFQALATEPRHLLPLLRWLGLALQGLAPRRTFAGQLLSYEEARGEQGDFVLPQDGDDSTFQDDTAPPSDAPLAFPTLATLPFRIDGEGLYERPYTVGLRAAERRGVQGLLWLDPDGPPSGDAIDVALSVLAPALRDVGALQGLPLADLARVLDVLGSLDDSLSAALAGLAPAALGTGLQALEDFLHTSDGVLLTASQTPTATGWTQAVLEADHFHALEAAAVRTAIQQQLQAWDAAGTLPVLLLGGPGLDSTAWAPLITALGGAQRLSFQQAGVAPQAVSTAGLNGSQRVICAQLAALDASPGLSPTGRLVPVDAAAGASSLAEQVARLVQRLAELRPGQQVLIVAHSAAGLAARAAVQRAGLAGRIKGLLTIGTPHSGSPLPWQGSAPVAQAVGALQRLSSQLPVPAALQGALDSLWRLIAERAADGSAAVWPAHAYAPVGDASLPAGVVAHAIGLRLPAVTLASTLAQAIATRAQTLRTALAGRAPVTHLGVGLALAPVVPLSTAVRCETTVRLDLLQWALTGTPSPRALPRLVLQAKLVREGGWLVGDAASRIRVRWAELGVELSAAGLVPRLRLHDVAVEGQETVLATLREASSAAPGGLWLADELLVPALDELLARLTRGPTAVAEVTALARLLASVDLTQRRVPTATDDSGGYALHPDGWASLLADPASHVQQVLARVLADVPQREALLAHLRTVLGLSATDLSRLLLASAGDPPVWQALRKLLRALGLLDVEARGSAPLLSAWLALLRSPAAYLQAQVAPLLADATRRTTLLAELRDLLGVRDVGGTPEVDLPLGAGISLHVEALGRVSLRLGEVGLGAALQVSGAITLDLSQARCEADLLLRPVDLPTGLRWRFTVGGAWSLSLDFSDGERTAPFAELPLWPIPADLPARLGALLPRVTVSTLATTLLDQVLLPRLPELGPVLAYFGLATPADASTQTRARVQHLARVVADPLGWLQSSDTLFKPRAAGTGLELDPARLAGLVREGFGLFGLRNAAGDVALPLGLRLRIDTAPTARLRLDAPTPVTLAQGLSLGGEFTLGWSAAGTLGAGGQLALGADLPSGWGRLAIQAGVENGQIRLALGPEDGLIQLLPFSGFDAGAIGAAASRLLPTLIDASLQALQADAALVAFVTQLRNTANVLEVDTLTRLDALVDDPLAWLRKRFSAANAAASVQALAALVPAGQGVTAVGNELRFAPLGAPLRISLGRPGPTGLGIGITLTGLDLGPITLQGEITLGLNDSGSPTPVLGFELDAQVDDGVIDPAGVSIRPQALLSINTEGHIGFAIYPIGQEDGSPDFCLTVLPTFGFGVDEGTLAEGLLEFARRVLVPVVVETLLDTDEVTGWLNSDLGRGLKAGPILADAGLIAPDGGTGWNLAPLSQLLNPRARVEALIGAALHAMSQAFVDAPLIDFGVTEEGEQSGLFIAVDAEGAGDTAPYRYGVRVALPELRVSEDPEVIIRLGGRTDWIVAAGGPADAKPGITLMVLRDDQSPPPADPFGLPTRFTFAPRIDLAGVGIEVSGRGDEPLFDLGGVQLGGLEALTYLRLDFTADNASVDFGLYGDIRDLALPLGASDSNPVAQGLMSSGGGDQAPVNPRFSVRAAYVENFWLELGGTPDRNEVWFPIQKSFGPVNIQQVGIRWIGGANLEGAILVDGGVSLAGLAVGVDDLSLTVPFAKISDITAWKLGLRGIAVAYNGGGVKIGGGLLQAGGEDGGGGVRYDGFLLVEVGGKSFVALGSYGVVDGEPSLFVFVVLGIPIGGPPYFFITGLAGGFGYNRGLVVPPIEDMPDFPLVAAMSDASAVTDSPMQFLQRMGDAVPMERGSYWFAAGLKFTSFTLVNSQALLYVLLNRGLEIGLLGMSHMELPPGAPLVSVELALKARFSTIEGVMSVEARLTDNSWVLSRDCRLTGGFAFFLWFDGPHAGDFVISVGGYHPRWTPPDHYPVVPRLGFNWRVSSCISIKGESYFALTPREVMAGGLLEAVYDSGDIRAWFKAWANMYIRWRPFFFEVEIGISIGVSVDTWLGRIKIEVGASLIVWGPDIGGEVTVDVWVISITIPFGAGRPSSIEQLTWDQFRTSLLPPEDEKLFAGSIERGLVGGSPATGPWVLLPEFVLRTETLLAANQIQLGGGAVTPTQPAAGGVHIDVKPMEIAELTSIHKVRITRVSDGADLTGRFQVREELASNVPRALWDTDKSDTSRTVMRALTGTRLVASIDFAELDSTGAIPWATLFDDQGRVHPLPFARELTTRNVVSVFAGQALLLDAQASKSSPKAWYASQVITSDPAWAQRRDGTLQALASEGVRIAPSGRSGDVQPRGSYRRGRRNAPPLVRSLHEGLAGEATLAVDSQSVPPPAPPEVVLRPITPVLQAIVRQRVEPTGANGGAGANLRTTVKDRDALRLDVAAMQTLRTPPLLGAGVQRVASATARRATGMAGKAPPVQRGLQSPLALRKVLAQVEKAAMARQSPVVGTHALNVSTEGPARSRGAPLEPGTSLRFTLPTRDVTGPMPTLVLMGEGAARITGLDRAGRPLLDVETVGNTKLPVPDGIATLAVTGLGASASREVMPMLGAITLHEATHPVPVVGWQAHSELVALSDTTLQARGALLRLASTRPAALQAGTVVAQTVTDGQPGLETYLPPTVRTVIVVLDDAADDGADLASTLGLSARGAQLDDSPTVLAGGSRVVLVYDVISVDADAPWIVIPIASTAAWAVRGVMGVAAASSVWIPLLAETDPDTLVENGPLNPLGSLQLRFVS